MSESATGAAESGAADPAEPPGRRLDVNTIVDAGLAVAREPGAHSVTVRQLGTRLGADPTAIYRHFRSKDELMRALLDRLLGIARDRVTSDPDDWRAFLRELSEHTLEVFLEYPVVGAEGMRLSSEGDHELATIESILAALAAAGLQDAERIRYYGLISGTVIAFCSGIVSGRRSSVDRPLGVSLWVDRPFTVTAASHPQISAARDALLAISDRDIYLSAVELILDGIERTARA